MKALSRLLTLIVLLLLVAQAGVLYLGYERHRALESRVTALNERVDKLQSRVQQQRTQIESLEQESVSAMVDRANEVIVSGWEAIVQSVEKEMTRARQALEQLDRQNTNSSGESEPETSPETPQKD